MKTAAAILSMSKRFDGFSQNPATPLWSRAVTLFTTSEKFAKRGLPKGY
jgi:hypothetical protein